MSLHTDLSCERRDPISVICLRKRILLYSVTFILKQNKASIVKPLSFILKGVVLWIQRGFRDLK